MNIKGRLAKVEQGAGMVAEVAAPCEACAPVWQARARIWGRRVPGFAASARSLRRDAPEFREGMRRG